MGRIFKGLQNFTTSDVNGIKLKKKKIETGILSHLVLQRLSKDPSILSSAGDTDTISNKLIFKL